MFKNLINRLINNDISIMLMSEENEFLSTKLRALEDYLDIEFFHGDKSKPHYRKKRVIKRPVGRPRKKK